MNALTAIVLYILVLGFKIHFKSIHRSQDLNAKNTPFTVVQVS